MKVAQAISGQILANQISVLPVDVDQLPNYGSPHVMANFLCKAIPIKRL